MVKSHPAWSWDAVFQAKAFVGNGFWPVVMLGDEDITNDKQYSSSSLTRLWVNTCNCSYACTTKKFLFIWCHRPSRQRRKWTLQRWNCWKIKSRRCTKVIFAIIGRYLLTPEIFVFWNSKPGAGNEVQLTDAIDTLNKTQRLCSRIYWRSLWCRWQIPDSWKRLSITHLNILKSAWPQAISHWLNLKQKKQRL